MGNPAVITKVFTIPRDKSSLNELYRDPAISIISERDSGNTVGGSLRRTIEYTDLSDRGSEYSEAEFDIIKERTMINSCFGNKIKQVESFWISERGEMESFSDFLADPDINVLNIMEIDSFNEEEGDLVMLRIIEYTDDELERTSYLRRNRGYLEPELSIEDVISTYKGEGDDDGESKDEEISG